jgi:hypothetical protein
MLLANLKKPVLFAGPSLELCDQNLIGGAFECKRPIKRGDLEQLIDGRKRVGTIIILDGVYGSNLAITPTECRQAIKAGWTLIGGSSMGALRASELWSVGMMGLGNVYNLFRIGKLKSDADVAVSYNKDFQEELTLSIVYIRSVLGQLCNQKVVDVATARQLLLAARKIAWFERFPNLLLDAWRRKGVDSNSLSKMKELFLNPNFNPKKRDASYIISLITSALWPCIQSF